MKIASKILVDFIDKVRLNGTESIQECILDFQTDGVHMSAHTPSGFSGVNGWLYASAFQNYAPIGKIGVSDTATFSKIFDRFKETVAIEKKGNILAISEGSKSVEFELIEESFIKIANIKLDMAFDEDFLLDMKAFDNIKEDALLNKDTKITIETVKGKILFSNTGKYQFRTAIDCTSCKGSCTTSFGQPIIEATGRMEGTVQVKMGNKYPIMFIEKNDHMTIHILIAPYVDDEQEDEA